MQKGSKCPCGGNSEVWRRIYPSRHVTTRHFPEGWLIIWHGVKRREMTWKRRKSATPHLQPRVEDWLLKPRELWQSVKIENDWTDHQQAWWDRDDWRRYPPRHVTSLKEGTGYFKPKSVMSRGNIRKENKMEHLRSQLDSPHYIDSLEVLISFSMSQTERKRSKPKRGSGVSIVGGKDIHHATPFLSKKWLVIWAYIDTAEWIEGGGSKEVYRKPKMFIMWRRDARY